MNWSDLLAAFALYLVLEGITPFASPAAMKRAALRLASLPDGQMRVAGGLSMVAGLALLFVVRG